MKTIALLSICLIASQALIAQDDTPLVSSGTVKYTETVKLEIHLEGDAAQFANALPKERKSNKLLFFNPDAALYINDKEAEEEENEMIGGEGGMVHIRVAEPDNKLYLDLENKKTLEQREFLTRMFLIEGELETTPWKLTGNEKSVLGYPCREAILEKDSTRTVAWFTPNIPVSAGPGRYNNLPGLVLEVNVDDGHRTIIASSLDPTPVDADKLVKPKEGKKVTDSEFDKIVADKMKEMNIETGGQTSSASGHVMVISIQK